MKYMMAFFMVEILAQAASAQTSALPTAIELLQSADRARGAVAATEGISWTANIETTEADDEDGATEVQKVTYQIKVRGDNAIAEATAPARNKGELMLFNDRNLWFYKPGLKKPVSISSRQKLTGQAANGDIASTHYARDYDGTLVGEGVVNGAPAWKLELKAKAKNITYDRIRYWISKKDRLGVQAEFLTLGGDVFKRAQFEYKNRLNVRGDSYLFVSHMVIEDARNSKNRTAFEYSSPRVEAHPESLFNVNNLLR